MPQVPIPPDAQLWPITASLNAAGGLQIAGVDVVSLAEMYGTPLYLYDEATIRAQCRAYHVAFAPRWPDTAIAYAAKAYLSPALCRLLAEENMELDIVSTGELGIALAAGIKPPRIHLHGNYKSDDELAFALTCGVGRIVVDSLEELEQIETLARTREAPAALWLRVNPDVTAATHAHIQTGHGASKFGLALDEDFWEAAGRAARSPWLDLVGLHAHIGSQVRDMTPLADVTRALVQLAVELRRRTSVVLRELSPGGGLAVAYSPHENPPSLDAYAEAITSALREETALGDYPAPRLIIEPGRSIVAQAGVALYTVGSRKERAGGNIILAVDGGMGDNPRPALYGAAYHAALAGRMRAPAEETARVVGRYCESGDFLAGGIRLPHARRGDLLAIPVSGAYHLAMASNYNGIPRPAVVFLREGSARLVRRRETLEDLLRTDVGWSREDVGVHADD